MLNKYKTILFGSQFILSFLFVASAYSQEVNNTAARPPFLEILSKMMPMFAIVFFIFYFLVLKPQQQKLKFQEDLLTNLKKGDDVVTNSGIIAKVFSIENDFIQLDIGNQAKLKVEKNSIARLHKIVDNKSK